MRLRICDRNTLLSAGAIQVDDETGACLFLEGRDKLRAWVERAMAEGIHAETRVVPPSDIDFMTTLDSVLSVGGFCRAEMAERLRESRKGVTLPHVMS
jgi:hypothetical protein